LESMKSAAVNLVRRTASVLCTATAIGGMLALTVGLEGQATKLNAKPLPHAGASSTWDRPTKDFGAADSENPREALPPSLWSSRRSDYRDDAKQKKEDEEKQAKLAKEKSEKAKQDQINAINQYKQSGIDANNKAVGLARQGRWQEAVGQAELAVKIDPANEEFRKNLSAARCECGKQRMAKGDVTGAAHMFRKALAARSDNAMAGNMLSAAIKKMGLDPALGDNRIGLGDQLQAAGDKESAYIEYQIAYQVEPNARTYTKMGDINVIFQQYPTALSWYKNAITKDPDYGPAHRGLGYLYIMAKDFPNAVSELRKAVIINPADAGAGQSLVEIWRKQVSAQPSLAENHLGLGAALQLTGDFDGAESEYAQVEQFDRQNAKLAPARNSLARARKHREAEKHKEAAETFFNQGLKGEALSEMTQALMIEPNSSRYNFQMGEYLEAAGNYNAALQAYQKSVIIDPKNEEGARRMRDLMSRGPARPNQQQQSPVQQNQGNQGQSLAPQHSATAPAKNMFEGTPQGLTRPDAPAFTGAFRTHDDPQGRPVNQFADKREVINTAENNSSRKPPVQAANSDANNPVLKQAADLEIKGDFAAAATLLKQALDANLQSPEVHHRLGLTLVNLGQTSEALSELRIASALDPANKTFADDLARVLRIHQRSLTSGSGSGEGQ